ncbi:MAG: hypothetical protein A2X32_09725 [Elusimicrobia bacterium GWC2_64_44]|nr:MAG: hypothetical protein A2X32_09725 [Elusimicrobia bacterium GWC2_64_44]
MENETMKNVGDVLDLMALAEARVRNFYRACAAQWERDREFWLTLAAEEDTHYATAIRLCRLAEAKPEDYTLESGFSAEAYRSFAEVIRDNTLAVSSGAMEETEAVHTAQMIENSILESSVLRAVRTENKEFQALLSGMADQTREHAAMVKARFAGVIR